VVAIVLGRARHISGDDVDLLAAQPAIHFIEPDRGSAFSREEEFGQYQEPLRIF
jgi:hypothetical protein